MYSGVGSKWWTKVPCCPFLSVSIFFHWLFIFPKLLPKCLGGLIVSTSSSLGWIPERKLRWGVTSLPQLLSAASPVYWDTLWRVTCVYAEVNSLVGVVQRSTHPRSKIKIKNKIINKIIQIEMYFIRRLQGYSVKKKCSFSGSTLENKYKLFSRGLFINQYS